MKRRLVGQPYNNTISTTPSCPRRGYYRIKYHDCLWSDLFTITDHIKISCAALASYVWITCSSCKRSLSTFQSSLTTWSSAGVLCCSYSSRLLSSLLLISTIHMSASNSRSPISRPTQPCLEPRHVHCCLLLVVEIVTVATVGPVGPARTCRRADPCSTCGPREGAELCLAQSGTLPFQTNDFTVAVTVAGEVEIPSQSSIVSPHDLLSSIIVPVEEEHSRDNAKHREPRTTYVQPNLQGLSIHEPVLISLCGLNIVLTICNRLTVYNNVIS